MACSLLATMIFPNDDEEPDRYKCARLASLHWRVFFEHADVYSPIPVVHHELYSVLQFLQETSFDKLKERFREGVSVGHLLKLIALLDRDSTTSASIERGIYLMTKLEPLGARTIKSRWRRYKNVAPYWAALNEFRYTFSQVAQDWQNGSWISFMKDPRPVLAIANNYRQWATRCVIPNTQGLTILQDATAWTCGGRFGELPTMEFLDPKKLYTGLQPGARELMERYNQS